MTLTTELYAFQDFYLLNQRAKHFIKAKESRTLEKELEEIKILMNL